jgi:hypothetical protein
MPSRIEYSTALRLITGSTPGMPMHTGQTRLFGSPPKSIGHEQNILVFVASWT